jgi:hypothetical protein
MVRKFRELSTAQVIDSRTPAKKAAQRSLAVPQVRVEAVKRRKEITLGFFFDEVFAMGRFMGGDDFFGEFVGHVVVVRELHRIGGTALRF